MKQHVIAFVIIVVGIGILWYFFDYRPGYPTSPDELRNATTTLSAPPVSTTETRGSDQQVAAVYQSPRNNFMHTVTIETTQGNIIFETYDADAPKTVENFLTLAKKGFYGGTIFHRVINGFMIQGGDPTGTGMGGPGYQFADELNPTTPSYKAGYVRGTVAMANAGPDTNGSQFFIMHRDTPLPHNYTIFGKVVQGIEVVDAIATAQTGAQDRPLEPVTIQRVTVTEKK